MWQQVWSSPHYGLLQLVQHQSPPPPPSECVLVAAELFVPNPQSPIWGILKVGNCRKGMQFALWGVVNIGAACSLLGRDVSACKCELIHSVEEKFDTMKSVFCDIPLKICLCCKPWQLHMYLLEDTIAHIITIPHWTRHKAYKSG